MSTGCQYGFSNADLTLHSDLFMTSYTPIVPGYQVWSPSSDLKDAWLHLGLPCIGPQAVGSLQVARVRRTTASLNELGSETLAANGGSWGRVKSLYR